MFPRTPKRSRLATASLLLSLLFFIPLLPAALSLLLGMAAMFRIRRSRGALYGRVHAVVGCVISLLVLMLTTEVWSEYERLSLTADAFLHAAGNGDVAEVSGLLSRRLTGPGSGELAGLADAIEPLGAFEGKRWGRRLRFQVLSRPYTATATFLVRFSSTEQETPVHFGFVLERGDWRVNEVRM